MRCFVGVPLPDSYQDQLAWLVRQHKPGLRSDASWTRPGNWHVTLKFLGQVENERLPGVAEALRGISFEAFDFQAGGAGFFPDPLRPRVAWIGVKLGNGTLRELAAQVDGAMEPLGFEREKRAYTPHLTLARVKRAKGDDWVGLLRSLGAVEWPVIRAGRMVLWESRLSPVGPSYSVLESFGPDA